MYLYNLNRLLLPKTGVNFYEATIRTLPHLKYKLVSVLSSLPCVNIGVRIELT